jgi:uncharacterized membrane protein affecting hemolysin expression
MKIHIRKTMQIPEIPADAEMETGSRLRDLLDALLRSSYFAKEIIDPITGDLSLDGLFRVSLNDVPSHSLPAGMETELKEGDTLTLTLILIGGG